MVGCPAFSPSNLTEFVFSVNSFHRFDEILSFYVLLSPLQSLKRKAAMVSCKTIFIHLAILIVVYRYMLELV